MNNIAKRRGNSEILYLIPIDSASKWITKENEYFQC